MQLRGSTSGSWNQYLWTKNLNLLNEQVPWGVLHAEPHSILNAKRALKGMGKRMQSTLRAFCLLGRNRVEWEKEGGGQKSTLPPWSLLSLYLPASGTAQTSSCLH